MTLNRSNREQEAQSHHAADLISARQAALHRYAILGSPPELAFDRIVRLTRRALQAPIVAITFITDDCQYTKAGYGPCPSDELPLKESFCRRPVQAGELIVAADTRQDPRFREIQAVKRQQILFYAGAPLTTPDGGHVGTLSIMDAQPRLLTPDEEQLLRDYAQIVVSELEARAARHSLQEVELHLQALQQTLQLSKPVIDLRHESTPSDERSTPAGHDHETLPVLQQRAVQRLRKRRLSRFTRTKPATGQPQDVSATNEQLAPQEPSIENLRRLAYYDSLTGLPNRTLFSELLTQALNLAHSQGNLAAVGLLDLDAFKSVNDTFGHAAGDELLVLIANRLSGVLRPDSTLARLGGDEFTLLIPNLESESHLPIVAERLMKAFSAPFRLQGRDVQIHGSLGLAVFPLDAVDERSALTHADAAMYQAKRQHLAWRRYSAE